ncbi:hypothetical protein [Arthrobacter mobilis]|uniref:hypothetical protein n=1 Tax=Arthrobacter mobilis TaxID=2724944 RepID=UPI00197B3E63|nr:hypothetical protein [Arthrobacter mobilis]
MKLQVPVRIDYDELSEEKLLLPATASFERAGPLGLPLCIALLSGPQDVARRVEYYRACLQQNMPRTMGQYALFGHGRYTAQVGLGGLPFAETARSIEQLATGIMPVAQKETRPARRP